MPTMTSAKEHATEIVHILREHGHQAYFAGGCVRDLLLGREPADYDVATDATPPQVMQIFPETYAVGEYLGFVRAPRRLDNTTPPPADGATGALARPSDDRKGAVEVATFRSD